MTYEEYAPTRLPSPYILEYAAGEGRLLLVGVQHTLDANSDMIARIWSEWGRFQPTVAFYEGTESETGSSQAVVGEYGEPAVVRFLAFVNRVPVTSIEPDMVDEIESLRKSWNDEQIKLFYALRFVAEHSRYGGAPITEAKVTGYLERGFPPTIDGPPHTIEELGTTYAKHYPSGAAWRRIPLEWFSPQASGFYSNDMARASGRFRDEYMLVRMVERARRGDRVFVAVGSAHAHMLEPALTDALGKPELKLEGP